jgi:hypothetical protein
MFGRRLTLWVFLCIVAGIALPVMLSAVKIVNGSRAWYKASNGGHA